MPILDELREFSQHGGRIGRDRATDCYELHDVDPPLAAITANAKLLDRPSACILWIYFDPDTMLLGPYLWFGGAPKERIPPFGEKVARHTKHNARRVKADRPGHRVIAKSRFTRLNTIDEVIQKLIGL
jgi:hypothetical protein